VKVDSRNQTLILASERRGPSDKSTGVAAGALKRASIAASQADADVVYVTSRSSKAPAKNALSSPAADESPGTSPTSGTSGLGALVSLSRAASTSLSPAAVDESGRDPYGNQQRSARDGGGLSSYLSPVEQYARTQRNLSAAPSAYIDVLA
jgi:hypothetical protein